MSTSPIVYNLLRLVMAANHITPRGVDRIDLGYLTYLLEHWQGDFYGALPSVIGPRLFSRRKVAIGCDRLKALWKEGGRSENDPALSAMLLRLHARERSIEPVRPRGFLPDASGLVRIARVLLGDGISIGTSIRHVPEKTLYLDVGHYGLTVPRAFGWRRHRPDIATVFMVHDTIPLEYPELVAEETVKAHQRLIMKVAKNARALIVPTQAAGAAIGDALHHLGARPIPIRTIPLPIDDLFQRSVAPLPELAERPYFVICGAIEPRKNLLLLRQVWRDLVVAQGSAAPLLVIAGAPGHESRGIIEQFENDEGIRDLVIRAPGLASASLARLIAGARALLMPSFAEGFGLPPVEALALGTPTMLSDIPAHREAVGDHGIFLPAKNPAAWVEAAGWLLDDAHWQQAREATLSFTPNRWPSYMESVTELLREIQQSEPEIGHWRRAE